MDIMEELEQEKELLEQAVYRKRELKSIIKPLLKQYEAVKKEIEARKRKAERLIKEHQHKKPVRMYSDYLDTVKLEDSDLEFPVE
jgi:hypothetical protein